MEDEDPPASRRGPMVILVLLVVAVIGGIFLVNRLHSMSSIQDCMMSGRTNCAPISSGSG